MTSTEHDDIAPADFDLNAWIDGSNPTERSCVITARGDLVAQAEDLLRRYEAVERAGDVERGINDDTAASILAELESLEAKLEASRSTWYLRALTPDEVKAAARAADDAAGEGEDAEYTAYQIAAAVTRVQQPDGSRAYGVTPEQILRLRARLGERVLVTLVNTLARAMSEEPSITAPFSQTSSPDRAGRQ